MEPVIIRDAKASDIPSIVRLVSEVLAEFGLSFGEGSKTDEEVLRLPESYTSGGGRFWVAVDSSGIIQGTCGIYPIDEATFELRKMYIYPRSRGQGIAGQFLIKCIAFARENRARRIVLDTIHEMKSAIIFYEKNGFIRDDAEIRGSRCSRGYVLNLPT